MWTMITEEQKRMLEYNDNQVKNYSRNRAISIRKEKKYIKEVLLRRERTIERQPKKIKLYDYWITHIEYDELSEVQIDREIEFWFDNYK